MCTVEKPLLTIDEQIEKMLQKGITIKYCSKDDAKQFLTEKNNYFRLMAYRQIYDKNPVGDNIGKYRGLDFQYLKELSAIDMHFRFLIIKMCLDIEHYLKIDLLNKAEKRGDNGYEGVDLFFQNTQAERIKHNIYGKRFSPYCSDLINYCFEFDEDNNSISSYEKCRIWDLLECLTFGEFLTFYEFYHQQYKIHNKYIKIINSVKSLRNACAHNNCVLSKLRDKNCRPCCEIAKFVSNINGIGTNTRKTQLSRRVVYETVCLIYIYKNLVPNGLRSHRITELKELFTGRMKRHSKYFSSQQTIQATYKFIKKILDTVE